MQPGIARHREQEQRRYDAHEDRDLQQMCREQVVLRDDRDGTEPHRYEQHERQPESDIPGGSLSRVSDERHRKFPFASWSAAQKLVPMLNWKVSNSSSGSGRRFFE